MIQVTGIVYLLTAVGIVLIGLGIYGIIKDRFSQETKGSGPGYVHGSGVWGA